jgi:hypothetical protein
MIKQLLNNELVVQQLEAIAEELEVMKESKGDFSFFLPKLIINIEALLKMYHFNGSNTFDYAINFLDTKDEKVSLQQERENVGKGLEQLYTRLGEVDARLLEIETHITTPEWKVWKEGHEAIAFETVKKFLK